MLQNLAVYPTARDVFYSEHSDRCYNSATFLLSYSLLELPFTALSSLVCAALAAVSTGLIRSVPGFLATALDVFCIVTCGESIGIIFNTLFHAQDVFAVNVMSTCISFASSMAGVMSLRLPAFLAAMNTLSPSKYAVRNLAPLAMRGMLFTCSSGQLINGKCPISTGEEVLQLYHLEGSVRLNIVAIIVCAVAYRAVAFVVLYIAKR